MRFCCSTMTRAGVQAAEKKNHFDRLCRCWWALGHVKRVGFTLPTATTKAFEIVRADDRDVYAGEMRTVHEPEVIGISLDHDLHMAAVDLDHADHDKSVYT